MEMLKGLHNLEKKAVEGLRRASHRYSHSEVDGPSVDKAEKVLSFNNYKCEMTGLALSW